MAMVAMVAVIMALPLGIMALVIVPALEALQAMPVRMAVALAHELLPMPMSAPMLRDLACLVVGRSDPGLLLRADLFGIHDGKDPQEDDACQSGQDLQRLHGDSFHAGAFRRRSDEQQRAAYQERGAGLGPE